MCIAKVHTNVVVITAVTVFDATMLAAPSEQAGLPCVLYSARRGPGSPSAAEAVSTPCLLGDSHCCAKLFRDSVTRAHASKCCKNISEAARFFRLFARRVYAHTHACLVTERARKYVTDD